MSTRQNTHQLRVGPLVAGIVFIGFAVTWALAELGLIVNPDPGVFFPIILVAAGVVGLLASARRLFRDNEPTEETSDDR